MLKSLSAFESNMNDVDALTDIYDRLIENARATSSYDDLLRSKIVSSVSAFDKLLHDLIRIGMVEIYRGSRPTTPKRSFEVR
ncbi:hypothetical protein PCO31010_03600 [Pandoraea commovens]|uniref:Uncharacterized protein n=1 Tax=Pandoraea commovens TaxID=2508289 RepID=A0A5E4WZW1_9BURK|nr:hypothetical protein PCO31010_03600 [Pandoraea commovens]